METFRLTGYSPTTGHHEPGWAAPIPFDEACDLGLRYLQDAIDWVADRRLYVSFADGRRALIDVAAFTDRVTASGGA